MRFEIDAGNTLIKWRLIDNDGSIVRRNFVATKTGIVKPLANEDFFGSISSVLISNVSGLAIEESIASLLAPSLDHNRIFTAKSLPVMGDVIFSYDDVSRLGVDRCLGMVAAYSYFATGVLVVDCGSAITADIVSIKGLHLGGYILPGISLLKGSLLKGTARIDVSSEVNSKFSPGKSTETCVENGIHLIIRSTITSLREIALEYGISKIVLTGGDAERVVSMANQELEYHRDLVFDGLGLLNPY